MINAYGHPQGKALHRLNTLASMICAAIKTGKSHLHELGSELPQQIDIESRVKKVKRWLLSKYTDYEVTFLPFVEQLLAAYIEDDKEMVFAIDGSEVGRGCTALMISLTIGNRAVPICWLVKKCGKGHLPATMHLEVFTILHDLLDGYKRVVVLGDGEFDNGQVVEACAVWQWKFVFRTAKNTQIDDGQEQYRIDRLEPRQGESCFIVHDVVYTKKGYGPLQAMVWHQRRHKDAIYLLSNFELSYEAVFFYEKRWSIETLFGDLKSRGFNIQKSKLSDPERLTNLLIVLSLAYILTFKVGQNEQQSPLRGKVTRKDRMDISVFTLGRRLILYCVKYEIDIVFSFSHKCYISSA